MTTSPLDHPAELARAFHRSCVAGDLARAKELKEYMELPDAYPTTTLLQSLQRGKWEIAKFLWTSFSSKTKDLIPTDMLYKNFCMGVGADYNKAEVRKLSMEFLGEDVFSIETLSTNFFQSVKLYMNKGTREFNIEAPESQVDELGWNELHWACSLDQVQIVKILIEERKYNMETCETGGSTPLLIAAQSNCFDVLRYLVTMGANMSAKNTLGFDIFNIAYQKAVQRDYLLIEFLESSGFKLPSEYVLPFRSQVAPLSGKEVIAMMLHLQKESTNPNKLKVWESIENAVSIPEWKPRICALVELTRHGANPCKRYSSFYPLTNLVMDSKEYNYKLLDWCVEQGWAVDEDKLPAQPSSYLVMAISTRNPKITHLRKILKRFIVHSYPSEPTIVIPPPEITEEQMQAWMESVKQTAASSSLEGLRRQLVYRGILRIGEVMEIMDDGRWKSFNSWHYAENRKFEDEPLLIRMVTKCLSYAETRKHLTDVSFIFLAHHH